MELGIMLGNVPTSVPEREHFDSVLRQTDAAQRAGLTHILIGQHIVFEGSRWLQPIPLLARLAAGLDAHVRLCTQTLIGPIHHPVLLAEELATLDVVTEGRLTVGLGLGHIRKEYDTVGVPYNERGARQEELIEILKLMWTRERVTYEGRHFRLDDVATHIHPVQKPHPPIWIGAGADRGVRRAARLGDAWPITPKEPPGDLPRLVGRYLDYREQAGRSRNVRLPLRREIMIGRNRADALEKAVDVASAWYANMASATASSLYYDLDGIRTAMGDVIAQHWILGDAGECIAQLRAIAEAVPVDPIITRANWPGMSTEDTVAYIEMLGRELVPALAEIEPVRGERVSGASEPV